MKKYTSCIARDLPPELRQQAAAQAIRINPTNEPQKAMLPTALAALVDDPQNLALLTSKWWGSDGAKLTVSFMDNPSASLRGKILAHMNAWGDVEKGGNVEFVWTQQTGQVRIYRGASGYWSYLGTDILQIPAGEPTMNLERFTASTPDGEFKRVVRHETGHTLGFPHEHTLPEIIERLDVNKTIAWGRTYLGWSQQDVVQQILTPPRAGSYRMSKNADVNGIMCYMLPAAITKDGKDIPGGLDIDDVDYEFVRSVYPRTAPPPATRWRITLEVDPATGKAVLV